MLTVVKAGGWAFEYASETLRDDGKLFLPPYSHMGRRLCGHHTNHIVAFSEAVRLPVRQILKILALCTQSSI